MLPFRFLRFGSSRDCFDGGSVLGLRGFPKKKRELFSKFIHKISCTVGKIYTPIFWFFRKKRVVDIAITELKMVSKQRSGDFTFYRSIHELLDSPTRM